MTTFEHRTPDGAVHTRQSRNPYQYVRVARWTRRDGAVYYSIYSWSAKCAGKLGHLYAWGYYDRINGGNA